MSVSPFLYGAAIAASGGLLVRAVSVRAREQIAERLEMREGGATALTAWVGGDLLNRLIRARPAALAGAGAVCAAVGFHLAGPVGGAAGLAVGPIVVEGMVRRRRAASLERAEEQLREAVAAMAAGVRAGLSVRRALAEAARDAEDPLRPVLEASLRAVDMGEPLDEALRRLAEAIGSADARLLVALLGIHRRSGGDLPVLLDEVSDVITGRVEARRQARALTAQGRASGVVLAVLPVAFVGLLSAASGNDLGAFYRTPRGATLLLAGLILDGLGFLWIRRILRTER